MKKFYALLNFVVIIGVVYWNYYANAQGINENSVGSLSAKYANLFTPAGYAFSIWGIIFLSLIANAFFQLVAVFSRRSDDFISKMGPWLIIANIGNAAWIWAWLTERTGLSVIIIVIMLISLLQLVFRLGIGTSKAKRSERIGVWFPVSLYAGWVTVATAANISAYLAKLQWQGIFSEAIWAVILLAIATGIYAFITIKRRMITFTMVGIWAILAIMMRHWGSIALIQWFSLGCIILLAFALMKVISSPKAQIATTA